MGLIRGPTIARELGRHCENANRMPKHQCFAINGRRPVIFGNERFHDRLARCRSRQMHEVNLRTPAYLCDDTPLVQVAQSGRDHQAGSRLV
jgi:hypothetical protein